MLTKVKCLFKLFININFEAHFATSCSQPPRKAAQCLHLRHWLEVCEYLFKKHTEVFDIQKTVHRDIFL